MSFLVYFFILLVSAASVLFGLDLMNAPLPSTPNVLIGRSVQVASQPPMQEHKKAADGRALVPVNPTTAARPKTRADTSGAAKHAPSPQTDQAAADQRADTGTTAETMTSAREEAPASSVAPSGPAATPPASVSETPSSQPAAAAQQVGQPAAQQTSSSCNIQACSAAYHSFRASDCTYQPAAGPRRACTKSPGAAAARVPGSQQLAWQPAGKVRPRRQPLDLHPPAPRAGEMREIERIVRQMMRGEDGDIPVQDADGNIIIIRNSYR